MMEQELVYGFYSVWDRYEMDEEMIYIEEVGLNILMHGSTLWKKKKVDRLWKQIWKEHDLSDWMGEIFTFEYGDDSPLFKLTEDGFIPYERVIVETNEPPHHLKIPFENFHGHPSALFDWERFVYYKGLWIKDWEFYDIWRYDEGKMLNKPSFYEKVLKI